MDAFLSTVLDPTGLQVTGGPSISWTTNISNMQFYSNYTLGTHQLLEDYLFEMLEVRKIDGPPVTGTPVGSRTECRDVVASSIQTCYNH